MLSSFLPTVTPGQSLSTMKAVMPPRAFFSGSVRATTKNHRATPALVIHILLPLSTHLSPFFTAVVFSPCTSEPAPGSVTA